MPVNGNFSFRLVAPLVDNQITEICIYLIYATSCQAIAVSGIATNIINIICFVRQGLTESVNVSLLGLAVSDLCCLITIIFTNISLMPVVNQADLPFDVLGTNYLVFAMPHFTFSRISAWITAIITLERSLCIIAPLQIKSVLTPKRMFVIIVCIYIILMSSGAPVYAVNRLEMIFSPRRNKTILGLVSTPDRESVEKYTFSINNFFLPFAAFAVILICTTILVISLRRRTEWRKTSTVTLRNDVNSRNMRVAKMVVMISALYIFCFIPIALIFLSLGLEPSINLGGKNVNIGFIAGGIGILMECINSSMNIFIYYHMSTKYRTTITSILFSR